MAKINGVESKPCPTCDGEGSISLKDGSRATCKTCRGTGAVKR